MEITRMFLEMGMGGLMGAFDGGSVSEEAVSKANKDSSEWSVQSKKGEQTSEEM